VGQIGDPAAAETSALDNAIGRPQQADNPLQ
jgi:hypothetical protein